MSHSVPLSFTPASNTGHQTIGKNGSFWLPPEQQASSFDSHLKKQMKPISKKGGGTPSVSSKQTSSPKFTVSKGAEVNVTKVNAQINKKSIGQTHQILSESKRNSAVGPNAQIGKTKSSYLSVRDTISRNHHTLSNSAVNQTFSHVGPYHKTKSLNPSSNGSQIARNLKFVNDVSLNIGLKAGIKDATSSSNADFFKRSKGSHPNDSERSSSNGGNNSNFLYETALRKILPLLSRTTSEQSDIVRFATELPSGDSLAMRVECNQREIKLVAICSNTSLHQEVSLSSLKLLESLESLTKCKTSFKIYSSYEEFDQHHTN